MHNIVICLQIIRSFWLHKKIQALHLLFPLLTSTRACIMLLFLPQLPHIQHTRSSSALRVGRVVGQILVSWHDEMKEANVEYQGDASVPTHQPCNPRPYAVTRGDYV